MLPGPPRRPSRRLDRLAAALQEGPTAYGFVEDQRWTPFRKGERLSFAETDYAALLDAAHQYLKAPIVPIRDNRNVHLSVVMRELVASRAAALTIQRL